LTEEYNLTLVVRHGSSINSPAVLFLHPAPASVLIDKIGSSVNNAKNPKFSR